METWEILFLSGVVGCFVVFAAVMAWLSSGR